MCFYHVVHVLNLAAAGRTNKPVYAVCLQPVGIANTVTKYQENKPVKAHLTPFEARLETKIAEEEVARAALQASSDVNESGCIKQQLLFQDGQQSGQHMLS